MGKAFKQEKESEYMEFPKERLIFFNFKGTHSRNVSEITKLDEINQKLKDNFQVNENLTAVFFDPFANMTNDHERKAVEENISTLWNFVATKSDFAFKSIEDVLNDLSECQNDTEILGFKNVIYQKIAKSHILISNSFVLFLQRQLEDENSSLSNHVSELEEEISECKPEIVRSS